MQSKGWLSISMLYNLISQWALEYYIPLQAYDALASLDDHLKSNKNLAQTTKSNKFSNSLLSKLWVCLSNFDWIIGLFQAASTISFYIH